MLDINFIRDNQNLVRQKCLVDKQKDLSLLDKVLKADEKHRKVLRQVEDLRAVQNKLNKEIKGKPTGEQLKEGKKIKNQLRKLEAEFVDSGKGLKELLEEIPNVPAGNVPIGKDDTENIVVETVGKPTKFSFQPLDHEELGKRLDIIDKEKAGQLSGSRFGYYKNEAAVLEMAIMFYVLKKLVAKGFKAMIPPPMIKSKTEWGCGYTSNKNLLNAYYSLPEDDLVFISSSEHAVVPYHSNEILDQKLLPVKYVNFSPCFRREAGTYGKDMNGMLRLHFFNKVEMNVFTIPDMKVSDAMCLKMLSYEREVLDDFGLPYQVVNCCTGDLPQPNRRMYDLNVWFPGQNQYRETGSCSNCTDYQARRLNTKVRFNGKNEYVHILNGTAVSDRPLLAILENYQQQDGSVKVPKVLWPLTGFKEISAK